MFTMALETGAKDVHSGLTGGPARNPIGELCKVISKCYDADTGRVKIEGFYDDVKPATKKELKSFLDSGFTTKKFKAAHELKHLRFNDAERVFSPGGAIEAQHGIARAAPVARIVAPHDARLAERARAAVGERKDEGVARRLTLDDLAHLDRQRDAEALDDVARALAHLRPGVEQLQDRERRARLGRLCRQGPLRCQDQCPYCPR